MSLTELPLSNSQKTLPSGALLPSGEANFFDFRQDRSYHGGSGINDPFPWSGFYGSGYTLLNGRPPASGDVASGINFIGSGQQGILTYNNVSGLFSNAPATLISGITDFTIFNPYIHYYPTPPQQNVNGPVSDPVLIPYISDYTVVSGFDIYSLINYQYYNYLTVFGN